MTLLVRRLTVEDHEQLRALRLRALTTAPTAFGSTAQREAAFPPEEWRRRLAPSANPHYGAFDGEQLVGLAVGILDAGEPATAWLAGMWLDPTYRGTGTASRLVAQVLDWAAGQGVTLMKLEVTGGNIAAETLYRRVGFEPTGRTTRRERDGMIELEMAKSIIAARA